MASDLSTAEQRKRAGVSPTGTHLTRRGRPKAADEVDVDGVRYTIVGQEERVDLPDHDADRRREAWREQRRAISQSARAARHHRPLHQRLRAVEDSVAQLQAPRARRIDPTERAGGEPVLPPGGSTDALAYADEHEVARLRRHVEKAVERLEDLLDAHRGIAPAKDYQAMDSHDKNAAILTEFVGWRPEEVVAFEPAFGTARTIRYVRGVWAEENWPGGAVRGVCGHREGHCTDACPKLRGPYATKT